MSSEVLLHPSHHLKVAGKAFLSMTITCCRGVPHHARRIVQLPCPDRGNTKPAIGGYVRLQKVGKVFGALVVGGWPFWRGDVLPRGACHIFHQLPLHERGSLGILLQQYVAVHHVTQKFPYSRPGRVKKRPCFGVLVGWKVPPHDNIKRRSWQEVFQRQEGARRFRSHSHHRSAHRLTGPNHRPSLREQTKMALFSEYGAPQKLHHPPGVVTDSNEVYLVVSRRVSE
mmetsp:Transcript_34156/g.96216  ORF Transcript_34156/g.96216 Transcript_34156/m.96216 type:complete len:227 (+) Transcript_34156:1284-1964(+)